MSEKSEESDYDDLLDEEDEHAGNWRERRMEELKAQADLEKLRSQEGHGRLREVREDEFLSEVTASKCVVCHFFHDDFRRCKILDQHLGNLAEKHPEAKFIKVNAEHALFFINKLQIKILPALLFFHDGVNTDRTVGFEDFGNTDDFPTEMLENRIAESGCIKLQGVGEGPAAAASILGLRDSKWGVKGGRDSDDDSD